MIGSLAYRSASTAMKRNITDNNLSPDPTAGTQSHRHPVCHNMPYGKRPCGKIPETF